MRTLIKLAIAALILHAAYRVGVAYWDHYQFEDAVQQLVQFADRESAETIKSRVLELAAESNLPITADDLAVTHVQHRIEVAGAYSREVLLAPGLRRPWAFTVHVVVLTLK
jgi:hypothetical protein